MKHGCFFGIFSLILLFSLISPAHHALAGATAGGDIAAKVNGEEITKAQVERAIDEFLPQAFFHSGITPEKRNEFRPQALDALIKKELYYQAATKQGMAVGKEELEAAVKKIRDRFKSEKEFRRAVKEGGYTVRTLEKQVERTLLVSKFVEAEITGKARVTDEYLREYYEKNKKGFLRPEAFRMRHILIKVPATATEEEREKAKKEAEDVLAKAKKGEDFGDLAYKYSMDDWRVKGGDLGVVHKGRLDPSLEEAALKLEPGQVSGIIETIYGYHILKLEKKYPPVQMTFDEMKDALRKQLESKRSKEIEDALLRKLKADAKIEVY